MSALFDHLRTLLEEGHKTAIPDLLSDVRFDDQKRSAKAAVLMAVRDCAEPSLILTQRPNTMKDHPGQVAFPGGKQEPGEDAVTAALREAEEEIGLSQGAVRIVGATDLYHTGTGFIVTPVLAVIPADTPLSPDPREVEACFEVPLDLLLRPSAFAENHAFWKGKTRHYLSLDYQGYRIWGVTAAIIANLGKRLSWPHGTNEVSRRL